MNAMLNPLLALTLAASSPLAGADDFYAEQRAWREARLERLAQPFGWLSLTGLHFLADGVHRVGRGEDNDLRVASGPERLGRLHVDGARAWILLEPGVQATVGGLPVPEAGGVVFRTDLADPTVLQVGQVQFMVRDHGRLALRIRDANAPTRLRFGGLDYFDPDPAWRIEARWEAYEPARTIELVTVADTEDRMRNPGAVVFEVDGRTFRLDALQDQDDEDLFLIVADRTNGRETYGMARYLYAPPPVEGRVILDFNRLFNPPCAFTPYATCALPPPQNRLDLAITAGEKRYRGMREDDRIFTAEER